MAYYIIKLDGKSYVNEDLFVDVIAGGERSALKMVSRKEIVPKEFMGQVLYALSGDSERMCLEASHIFQDIDEFYKSLNYVSKEALDEVKKGECSWLPGATVITVGDTVKPELYKWKHLTFMKAETFRGKTYNAFRKMAAMKICGRSYIALDAVGIFDRKPIIVTLKTK